MSIRLKQDRKLREVKSLGLSKNLQVELLNAIVPGKPNNPWPEEAQERNELIILLFLLLGLRTRELINIHVRDIDVQEKCLYVGNDRARKLFLRDLVTARLFGFLQEKQLQKEHLLFQTKFGAQMTPASLRAIFAPIPKSVPGIPSNFSAYMCRRTWIKTMSEACIVAS